MVVVDGRGFPLGVQLYSASPAEVRLAEETLAMIRVGRRHRGGRPRQKPARAIADKGYDSDALRKRLRRKASYYWFRRSAAPVKVLVRSRDGHLVTRVVNDTLRTYQAEVRCGWVRLDGKARELQKHSVTIPVNGMIEIASAPFPSSRERNRREWLYAATLTGEGIAEDQAIWLLGPHCELALAKPVISTTVQNGVLEVSSPVYCHGVHLEDEGHEVLADNYFDLLPGIPRHISITTPTASGTYPLTAIVPIAP